MPPQPKCVILTVAVFWSSNLRPQQQYLKTMYCYVIRMSWYVKLIVIYVLYKFHTCFLLYSYYYKTVVYIGSITSQGIVHIYHSGIKSCLPHMKQVYEKKISKFQLFVHIFQTWFSLGTGPWGQKFLVQWPPFFLKISYIPNNTIFGHIFLLPMRAETDTIV